MPTVTYDGETIKIVIKYDILGLRLDNDKLLLLYKGIRILDEQQALTSLKWKKRNPPSSTLYDLDLKFADGTDFYQTLDLPTGGPAKLVSISGNSIFMTSLSQIIILRDHIRRFHEDLRTTEVTVTKS